MVEPSISYLPLVHTGSAYLSVADFDAGLTFGIILIIIFVLLVIFSLVCYFKYIKAMSDLKRYKDFYEKQTQV